MGDSGQKEHKILRRLICAVVCQDTGTLLSKISINSSTVTTVQGSSGAFSYPAGSAQSGDSSIPACAFPLQFGQCVESLRQPPLPHPVQKYRMPWWSVLMWCVRYAFRENVSAQCGSGHGNTIGGAHWQEQCEYFRQDGHFAAGRLQSSFSGRDGGGGGAQLFAEKTGGPVGGYIGCA